MVLKRNFNLANVITFLRAFLIIPIVYFIFIDSLALAGIFFLITTFMDILDGALARKLKQETKLGNYLDSFVDSTTLIIILVSLLMAEVINFFIFLLLIMGRILSFSTTAYFFLKKKINYKPLYVKSGMFVIYLIILYIFFLPYNIHIIFALIAYTYLVIVISYTKILNNIYTSYISKKKNQ